VGREAFLPLQADPNDLGCVGVFNRAVHRRDQRCNALQDVDAAVNEGVEGVGAHKKGQTRELATPCEGIGREDKLRRSRVRVLAWI
jgi:hypothetical protein